MEEYRIDQSTGEIFTREGWDQECLSRWCTEEPRMDSWSKLPVIELPPDKEDEIRKKMRFIYGRKRVIPGDLITKDVRGGSMYIVENVGGLTMKVREISTHHSEIWSTDEIFYKVIHNPNQADYSVFGA